ncbi:MULTISPECIES: TetR/AcrR family transcriptional regulator [unclassified Streptomyces]|uniref:TetR/AcrR family transcriptional regulator n=1 Tax=unclassified Streptomyces TaxID=2593676 RepID=UPI00224E3643|nr:MULTISPECIES: TetR/AcrR family transcriptional regulator [unclassified Streptomyces]MCX4528812.1 TetR/AcrR family transcriptional regulator [Streptomyces sp. NBC_01551]MCX4540580.1 TetR/AcrR family transcriptional regulator [Streptomyces sp. NBC_01565]
MATPPPSRAGTKGVPRARREEQILAAATEEFGSRGYAGASLADVAARVGVTKTLLHQYFGAKQDLYLACLVPVGDRLVAVMREAVAEGAAGPSGTPLLVLRGIFTALEGRREAWFLLYETSLPADSEAARRAAEYRAAIGRLAADGTAGLLRAAGSADPLDADALNHVWQGLVATLVRWWIKHPDQSPDAMARRCARLFAVGAALAPDG